MPVDRNVIDNQMSRLENKTRQKESKGRKASAESPFFKRASAEIRLKKLVSTDRSEIRSQIRLSIKQAVKLGRLSRFGLSGVCGVCLDQI